MKRHSRLGVVLAGSLLLSSLVGSKGASAASTQLLTSPWSLQGQNGAAERYQSVAANVLQNASSLTVTYDLHGLCALSGDASAIIFDQRGWKTVALSNYGQNCKDGPQTVTIPLSNFKDIVTGTPLDTTKPLDGMLHTRFWASDAFTVDVASIELNTGSSTTSESTGSTTFVKSSSLIQGITSREVISGTKYISYNANPAYTRKVDFYLDGVYKNSDTSAPYVFMDETKGFDTRSVSNGSHMLHIYTQGMNGSRDKRQSVIFYVNNPSTGSGQAPSTGSGQVAASPTPAPTAVPSPTPTPTVTPSPTVTPKPTATPTPTPKPTPTPSPITQGRGTWSIQSVDAMKDTKDAICNPRSRAWIESWVDKAVELGANYVAISQPYDNPGCGNAVADAKQWVEVIRSRGLKVWHRHMPLAHEGIYDTPKNNGTDYLSMISSYIKNNPTLFADGDIFTPIPEPQNGGIQGITGCVSNVCQYSSKEHFNAWLRNAMSTSNAAFQSIGRNNMKVGYFGFDGFIAWGANNPDWDGILEDATVAAMGNIAIDHYPEMINSTMAQGLKELTAKYPNVDIILSEWGTANGVNVEQQVKDTLGAAAATPNVKGVNYWQFGPHGSGEQLIKDNFANNVQFDEVQSYYK